MNRNVNDKRMKANQLFGGERVENRLFKILLSMNIVGKVFLRMMNMLKDSIKSLK